MRIASCTFLAAAAFLFNVQEAGKYQLAENNVIVRFGEQSGEAEAREILAIAAGARRHLMEKYHLPLTAPVEIRLSATTAEFCQRTGRRWWQASIYQDCAIYLQPVRVLRERGILAVTLRHELTHHLMHEHAKGKGPAWLYEALAVYNSGEIEFLRPRSADENFAFAPGKEKTSQAAPTARLSWRELEMRLQKNNSRAESEQLYFQLYHLGRFLEQEFQSNRIAALLFQLGTAASFTQACRAALGAGEKELEQRWLRHWEQTSAANTR